MTTEQIAELAKQIQSGVVWAQWSLYLLMGALVCVALYFRSRLSSYASKTGEIAAITGQFEELTRQLKTNTETVEKVKAEIAHEDWTTREWKTIRRLKLEELLKAVLELKEWEEQQRQILIFGSKINAGNSPKPNLELIQLLYFPELEKEIGSLCQCHYDLYMLTSKFGLNLISETNRQEIALVNSDRNEFEKGAQACVGIRFEYVSEHQPIYTRALEAKSTLENKARELLRDIVGL